MRIAPKKAFSRHMPRLTALLFAICAVSAFGQRAPDIARGTAEDAVVRLYGWPKGKSVTDGRESWLYDQFQVLFENGKVVSVSYIAPTIGARPGGNQVQRPMISIAPSRASSPQLSPQVTAPGATVRSPAVLPTPRSNVLENTPAPAIPRDPNPLRRNESSGPQTSSGASESGAWTFVLAAGAFASAGYIIALVLAHRRTRSLNEQLLNTDQPASATQKKTWEDHVAEKLRSSTNDGRVPVVTRTTDRTTTSWSKTEDNRMPSGEDKLTSELLGRLEWKRFELVAVRYFSATGVRAEATCIGADGGVDAYLYRDDEQRPFAYVQCKAWGNRVGVKPVRELFGVMASDNVSEGFFLITGDFTEEARRFAEGKKLKLISGQDFISRFNALPGNSVKAILAEVTDGDYTTPTCPNCDVKLLSRENEKDRSRFWGCRNYPRCKYTLNPRADVEV